MNTSVSIPKDKIRDFCERNHINRLSLFGSIQRDDFNPDSDIDILVEFETGFTPGFFRFIDMEEELSSIFNGRKVDLRTPEDLSRYFREDVKNKSEECYVK
ncbi:MAG: nucleotidyltransferase family protein [Candidatus Omnitrophica bacterium]|nr:nucleotidyltransferase family protein [Candidatus Omnitrophota bacterium]